MRTMLTKALFSEFRGISFPSSFSSSVFMANVEIFISQRID